MPRPEQPGEDAPQQNLHDKQAVAEHAASPQPLISPRRTLPHLRPQNKSRTDTTQRRPRERQEQKRMMQTRMAVVVENRNADPARTSRDLEHARQDGNPFLVTRMLVPGFLGGESALAAGEVHGYDGQGEGERGDDPAGYEERLQAEGADVGDEGYGRVGLARVAGAAFG